jgi:hypothetical protein
MHLFNFRHRFVLITSDSTSGVYVSFTLFIKGFRQTCFRIEYASRKAFYRSLLFSPYYWGFLRPLLSRLSVINLELGSHRLQLSAIVSVAMIHKLWRHCKPVTVNNGNYFLEFLPIWSHGRNQQTWFARNIPSSVCAASPEDEQVMIGTCKVKVNYALQRTPKARGRVEV